MSRRVWPVRRRPAPTPDDLPADPFPAEPDDPPPPPPRARVTLPALRLAALGLALVLTIAITMVRLFVGGSPSVEELRARAGVDGWTTLSIGVKDDQPGTAFREPDGSWSGFDIDIAYMIAEDLGSGGVRCGSTRWRARTAPGCRPPTRTASGCRCSW